MQRINGMVAVGSVVFVLSTLSCSGSDGNSRTDGALPPDISVGADGGALCGGAQCPENASCVSDNCVCDSGYWPATDGSACVAVDLLSGLVTHYPLDGDAVEASGQGTDCSLAGPKPADDRFGDPGKALSFDGVDDYLSCGVGGAWDTFAASQWTFAVWINIAGDGDAAQTLLNGIYHRPWITVNNYSHVHLAYMDQSGTYTPSASTQVGAISANQWIHVAVVSDGVKYTMYVDGLKSGDRDWGAIGVSGVDHYRIGNTPNGDENFKGRMDEVRFYERALIPEEVDALYAATAASD